MRLRERKLLIWRIISTGKDPVIILSVLSSLNNFRLLIRVMETAPVLLEKNIIFTKNVKKD